MDSIGTDQEDAPTHELLTSVVGDRCSSCQQPLASDQRYCVNCGARRGKSRFSYDSMAAQAPPAEPPGPAQPHRTRISAATTLVAGIATLLLAMGVGVLIGHNGNSSTRASAPAQIVTVGSGGVASNAASSGGATASLKKHGKVHKVKAVVVHLTAKTLQKANAAAAKVFGNNGGNLVSNPTEQVGGSCSGGAGCQNGKFTGNFFSP